MIVFSWNCCILGTSFKVNVARDVLAKEHRDIYMIQETKLNKKESKKMIQKLKKYEVVLEAIGASGEINTIWDKRKWELMTHETSRH